MKKIFALIMLTYLPVFAQSNITVYSGITLSSSFNDSFSTPSANIYWHNGVNIGVSSNVRLTNIFYISPTFEYSSYSFDKYGPTVEPMVFNGNTIVSINGENLKNYRLAVDFKLIQAESSLLRFFVHTGVSYLIEAPGAITTVSQNPGGALNSYTETFSKTNYFAHNLGIGFIADIIQPFGLSFEGQYFSNYNGMLRFSLNGGIVYNFD